MSSRTLYAQHPVSISPRFSPTFLYLGANPAPYSAPFFSALQPKLMHLLCTAVLINRLYAKNPVFEIVHEEGVKVYHLHMYNGNIQQNSMRRIPCHWGISHLSSVFACVFSSRCNVLHVICEHHALGAVLLSSMRLVRSVMGE